MKFQKKTSVNPLMFIFYFQSTTHIMGMFAFNAVFEFHSCHHCEVFTGKWHQFWRLCHIGIGEWSKRTLLSLCEKTEYLQSFARGKLESTEGQYLPCFNRIYILHFHFLFFMFQGFNCALCFLKKNRKHRGEKRN